MCTVRGDSRTLSAVLADEKSHFYMYFEIMKTLADNTVCVLSGRFPDTVRSASDVSHFYMYFEVMNHNIAHCTVRRDSRTHSAVLAGELSHFHMYFEIVKRLAHNTVCVLSGEIPGHCQQC
jgi:hypothetical protein